VSEVLDERRKARTTGEKLMVKIGKWLVGILMTAAIVLAFTYPPVATRPNYGTGTIEPWPEFRIFFFHVPAAWIAVLAFAVAMIYSIGVLRTRERRLDDVAMASSGLGFLFCALALVSGMIWARHEWGAFWNWDPRQNTVLILLLIYGGYFTLRSAVPDPGRRARLAGVYSIIAFVTVPFLVFIVPRIMESLHPSPIIKTAEGSGVMDAKMRQVFFLFIATYTGLYIWMLSLKVRAERVSREVLAR
jgi:heme exporter protein C